MTLLLFAASILTTMTGASSQPASFRPEISGEVFSFRAFDGLEFRGLHWAVPDATPVRAVVLAIHGLSGAADDFEPLGRRLPPAGFPVISYDLRGQGNDPRPKRRGDLKDPRHWLRDLRAVMALAADRYPNRPVVLYGESMGALIAIHGLAHPELAVSPAGLVLASPVVHLEGDMPWYQRWLARLLLLVFPTKRISPDDFADDERNAESIVTRDAAYQEYLQRAPHHVESYTLRFVKNLFDWIERVPRATPAIHVPTAVLFAGNDIFVKPRHVEAFFQNIPADDKAIFGFPESYHLLLHDLDRERVMQTILDWLRPRFPGN